MPRELKATKRQVLKFIRDNEVVHIIDLMNEFGYSYEGSRNRLQRLQSEKMVEKMGTRAGTYCLTSQATRRLEYYDTKP